MKQGDKGVLMVIGLGAALVLSVAMSGCGRGGDQVARQTPKLTGKTVIAISGSDTMVNLAQMWAEEYKKKTPSVSIEVSGGGSGVGIRDLMQGVVQVANSSREMEPAERDQITKTAGKAPVETVVGHDGIAIYVHKDNPATDITMDQLARIFREGGDITRWSQLGVTMPAGQDEIVRVSRQNSSGTYLYFREHVLKKQDFKSGSNDMSGSKDVVELVTRTKSAIGYSGMGYATKDVKVLRIKPSANEAGIEPSVANVHSKSYPLARSLLMFTVGTPEGVTRTYIDWILSPEGQAVVTKEGYVPVSAEDKKK